MLIHNNKGPAIPARVVILGARGFVASALAARLASDGVTVRAIGSSQVDLCAPESVHRLAADLMPGDVVVMAAALTPDRGRDTGTLIRNLHMAEHVGAALLARSLAQLVYLSSDAVYASQAPAMDESTPAAPGDLYGLMHRARELILKEATDRAGIPLCVLRPCAIYGRGDTHNSYGPNRFIRTALKEGKIQVFGLGEDTRDHVYIDDVISLILKAVAHRSSGTLNVVSGNAVAFSALAKQIARLAGGRTVIESLPQKGSVSHRSFDPAAIQVAFPGFIPTSLDEGLARTIEAASRA